MKPSDEVAKFLEDVQGMVEATSFEKYCLWKDYHESYQWIEGRAGFGQTVGYFSVDVDGEEEKYPVVISLLIDVVNVKKILFYEATSVIVDWNAIDAWFKKHMPKSAFLADGRLNKTDAMNFHNIIR